MSRKPRVTERMIDVGMDLRFGSGWVRNTDDEYIRRSRELLRRQLEAAFELLEPAPQQHPGQLAIGMA
jgi:hypothetical protein